MPGSGCTPASGCSWWGSLSNQVAVNVCLLGRRGGVLGQGWASHCQWPSPTSVRHQACIMCGDVPCMLVPVNCGEVHVCTPTGHTGNAGSEVQLSHGHGRVPAHAVAAYSVSCHEANLLTAHRHTTAATCAACVFTIMHPCSPGLLCALCISIGTPSSNTESLFLTLHTARFANLPEVYEVQGIVTTG